jgi:hypothetical protein
MQETKRINCECFIWTSGPVAAASGECIGFENPLQDGAFPLVLTHTTMLCEAWRPSIASSLRMVNSSLVYVVRLSVGVRSRDRSIFYSY